MFKQLLRLGVGVAVLMLGTGQTTYAQEAYGSTAHRADDFVDSICVNTHWSYTDTPYGYAYEEVRDRLVESGIRNIRDGLYQTRAQELATYGIRSTIIVSPPRDADGSIKDIRRQLRDIREANAAGGLIDAVEGPNEPDLFWAEDRFNSTYNGKGFPEGALEFQRDLYTEVKQDPALRHLKVIGIALGVTYWGRENPFPDNSLANYVDWGNFHPYAGGNAFNQPFPYNTIEKYYWDSNFPSIALDEHPINFTTYRPPYGLKPMAATETGYSTYDNGQSETVHARYIPRLYIEYFRLGIKRTCTYEFLDEFEDPEKTNREANFGLIRRDLSPKPAFNAVRNLINLLEDPGTPFTPGELPYSLRVDPPDGYHRTDFVHHLLMQKRDGKFYLALWHEISNNDTSVKPPREINPPPMPTTVTFGAGVKKVTLHALQDDGSMTVTQLNVQNGAVTLDVPDKVVVLEIRTNAPTTVFNGGFETAGSTAKLAAGWSTPNNQGAKRVCNKPERNKFFARTGDCAYRFKGRPGVKSAITRKLEDFTAAAGDTLTFAAWVRMDKPATGAKVIVKVTYADSTKDKMKPTIKAETYDYQRLSASLPLEGAVRQVQVKVKMGGTSGKFHIDDVSLIRVPGQSPSNVNTEINTFMGG